MINPEARPMSAIAFTAAELRALAAGAGCVTLLRAGDQPGWANLITKDHEAPIAEMHDAEADVYLVVEGEADLYLGGALIDPASPAAGQYTGSGLAAAECRRLAPGDVIFIPPRTPHMVDARHSRLVYVVVKIACPE